MSAKNSLKFIDEIFNTCNQEIEQDGNRSISPYPVEQHIADCQKILLRLLDSSEKCLDLLDISIQRAIDVRELSCNINNKPGVGNRGRTDSVVEISKRLGVAESCIENPGPFQYEIDGLKGSKPHIDASIQHLRHAAQDQESSVSIAIDREGEGGLNDSQRRERRWLLRNTMAAQHSQDATVSSALASEEQERHLKDAKYSEIELLDQKLNDILRVMDSPGSASNLQARVNAIKTYLFGELQALIPRLNAVKTGLKLVYGIDTHDLVLFPDAGHEKLPLFPYRALHWLNRAKAQILPVLDNEIAGIFSISLKKQGLDIEQVFDSRYVTKLELDNSVFGLPTERKPRIRKIDATLHARSKLIVANLTFTPPAELLRRHAKPIQIRSTTAHISNGGVGNYYSVDNVNLPTSGDWETNGVVAIGDADDIDDIEFLFEIAY